MIPDFQMDSKTGVPYHVDHARLKKGDVDVLCLHRGRKNRRRRPEMQQDGFFPIEDAIKAYVSAHVRESSLRIFWFSAI